MVKETDFKKCKNNWGLTALIAVYDCDRELIASQAIVKRFVNELCLVINMERHGDPLVDRFGDDTLEGVSCVQLIKTSSITVHCDEILNRVFVDIFSCKWFSPEDAAHFCERFFKAKRYKLSVVIRV